ncbi:MAG: hypothetical protein IJV27_00295 [Prevotella sp.]|nr:hypothetical protein [Prevotella sp.]
MKQTMKYLSIAALVAVGAIMMGCNKLDVVTEQTQQEEEPVISNTVTLTTTVSLDAATKALTADGEKTFAEGEQIALVYKNTSSETVVAVSEALPAGDYGKSATFTFELTDPDKAQNVTYIYPAAMAKADGTVNYDALATQNGTLATLSSTLDLATYSAAWNAGSLPAATLENQLAILALTLKNSTGSSDLTSTITGVTLSDGTKTYNVAREAVAGPIYVAIYPTADATIMVTATDGTKNYTKTLTGKTYAKGNGYSVSWKMVTAYTLAESTVGMIVGTDGKAYAAADKGNLPTGVTAAGMVAYKNGSNGLVIALADEANTMNWSTATGASGAAAHTPVVTGGTWKLPSKAEWNQMFGDDADTDIANYFNLNFYISTAGGTDLQDGYYWSSTEFEDGIAYEVELDLGSAYWHDNGYEDDDRRVRACLAF